MKFLIIGESATDIFIAGESVRISPESGAPVFVPTSQFDNMGMAANTYRNVLSILNKKYKKDKDEITLITNQKTREYITKTRYVMERTNSTLLRVDVGDKSYGHVSEHYGKNWFEDINFLQYDGVLISDYNKGFLTETDIFNISKTNPNTFLDTKRKLNKWCADIRFIKLNKEEYEKSQDFIYPELYEKLLITIGSNGTSYKNNIYPVKKVMARGVSGAGDSFFAGFCVSFIKNNNIKEAINYGNKIATICVSKPGVSIPYELDMKYE